MAPRNNNIYLVLFTMMPRIAAAVYLITLAEGKNKGGPERTVFNFLRRASLSSK